MNRTRSLSTLAVAIFLLALLACHNKESNKDATRTAEILQSPLFTTVNDSIRAFPTDAALYLRRAELLTQNDAHEAASQDYKKSWDLSPQPSTAILYAANLSITGKQFERLGFLQQCVQKYPSDAALRRLLAEANVDAGRSAEALALYNKLLLEDSLDFETWYEKALLLEKLKDTVAAINALKKVVVIQPVSTYQLELAHLYAETRNSDALKLCDQVIAKDSARELVDPFFIKGIYFANSTKYDRAILAFDSCIARDWKFVDAYLEKGIVQFSQKKYDEALGTFRLSISISRTDPDAYFWIGRCQEMKGKKDEAAINFERAIALDRNFEEAKQALQRVQR